ncbi:hypothetical protein QZH41_017548 [Actinostola sp. cb2023]|nr:hypothetical protein QZH41_017548 [Actinostola sp. cb2023]
MLAGPSGFHAESKKSVHWMINEDENQEEISSSFDTPPLQVLDVSLTKKRIRRRFTSRRLAEKTNFSNDSRLSRAHFALPPSTPSTESALSDHGPRETEETTSIKGILSNHSTKDCSSRDHIASPQLVPSREWSFHSCFSEVTDVKDTHAQGSISQSEGPSEKEYDIKALRNKFENFP